MLLARFVAGFAPVVSKQVRYCNPQNLQEALTTALAVRETEKHERFAKIFYFKFDRSVGLSTRSDGETAKKHSPKRTTNHLNGKRHARSTDRSLTTGSTRDVQAKAEPRCYECDR